MATSTPSTNLDATLKFTPTGATPPSTPTQPDEPGMITLPDGRKMKVTLEIKVNGVWKKVDTSKYGGYEKLILNNLAEKCQGIYEAATQDKGGKPKSLTVHFERNNKTESFWTSRVLGKVFTSLKEDVINLDFKKLEFKTAASDPTQVFDLENEELDPNEALTVRAHLKALDPVAKGIYQNARRLTANPKKPKPVDPVSAVIDQCIEEAGTKGNRCAALSLAKIELERPDQDIAFIVEKYDLDKALVVAFNAAGPEHKVDILAEALVQKAASAIESADPANPFLDQVTQDQRRPCLAAITCALTAMGKPSTGTPAEIVKQYADEIRKSGQMLDLPFFLALDAPFIIVHKPRAQTEIMAIGSVFEIPDAIDNCDLDDVNILFYTSKDHYQAVILTEEEHKTALRTLIRREIDSQIKSCTDRLKKAVLNENEEQKLVSDLFDLFLLYPKAKEEIVQKLKAEYPTKFKDEDIEPIMKASDTSEFVLLLRFAIHG